MKGRTAIHCPSPTCVLKVGEGRGFIIRHRVKIPPSSSPTHSSAQWKSFVDYRLVVTAAHCLPKLPPAHAAAVNSDKTYKLLGSLDGSKSGIWAECLFANPVADIAVLDRPSDQELGDEADAYAALTDDAPVLRIDKAQTGSGWVLALGSHWVRTTLNVFVSMGGGTSLSIDATEPGMSGSPILNDAGLAVGIVAVGTERENKNGERRNERTGPQPMLTRDLPGWLLDCK